MTPSAAGTGDAAATWRVFVALPLHRDAIAALEADLEPVRAASPAALRWQPPERWHLTLAFLGPVPVRAVPTYVERLGASVAATAPVTLRLTGSGRFGDRVLWVGVEGDVERVRELATVARGVARRTGIDLAPERFRPHLTVARSRDHGDLRPFAAALAAHDGPARQVAEVLVVRSHLGPAPRHEVLARLPLVGPVQSRS